MVYGCRFFKDGVLACREPGGFANGKDAYASIAEYLAMIEGLEALTDMGVYEEPVTVIGDAKSILDQMSGTASVNSIAARPLYKRALRLVRSFQNLTWCWTPRQFNRAADQLTRRAMNQMCADRNEYQAAGSGKQPHHTGRMNGTKMRALKDCRV